MDEDLQADSPMRRFEAFVSRILAVKKEDFLKSEAEYKKQVAERREQRLRPEDEAEPT